MQISSELFNFLKHLSVHNNKEWFNDNRDDYQLARKEFEQFVGDLIPKVAMIDKSVTGVVPKQCIFRIFRDVRFSKDKTPYKTNFGAYIAKEGRKSGYAGYYIHIEPDNSFFGGGVYMPSPPNLNTIRKAIYDNPQKFTKIINEKSFKAHFGGIWGEKLVGNPRGFDKNFEYIDLLKYKSYVAFEAVQDKLITHENYVNKCLESFKAMTSLNNFINQALT